MDASRRAGGGKSFQERLNWLFASVRPPGADREYTNKEVAQATGLSDTYIGYLRTGTRDNPTRGTMTQLATFFKVRPGLLIDDDVDDARLDSVAAQVALAQALSDPRIRNLALRASAANLSPEALSAVTAMIDHVQRVDSRADSRQE